MQWAMVNDIVIVITALKCKLHIELWMRLETDFSLVLLVYVCVLCVRYVRGVSSFVSQA